MNLSSNAFLSSLAPCWRQTRSWLFASASVLNPSRNEGHGIHPLWCVGPVPRATRSKSSCLAEPSSCRLTRHYRRTPAAWAHCRGYPRCHDHRLGRARHQAPQRTCQQRNNEIRRSLRALGVLVVACGGWREHDDGMPTRMNMMCTIVIPPTLVPTTGHETAVSTRCLQ